MTIIFRPACSIPTFISTMQVILVIVMFKESTSSNSLLVHKYSTKVVRTKYGPLRGVMIHIHPPVEAFLGVPYATPPVGSLRWVIELNQNIWTYIIFEYILWMKRTHHHSIISCNWKNLIIRHNDGWFTVWLNYFNKFVEFVFYFFWLFIKN